MTILNIHVAADHVLFGVDSHLPAPAGARYFTTKVFPLLHIPAVMGASGTLALAGSVYASLLGYPGGFEDLVDVLPDVVDRCTSAALDGFPDSAVDLCRALYALAGWSERAGAMRGFYWEKDGERSPIRRTEMRPELVVPWDNEIADAPSPSDSEAMRRLALAQHALLGRKCGATVAGAGPFYLGVLDRDAVRIGKLLDLPPLN